MLKQSRISTAVYGEAVALGVPLDAKPPLLQADRTGQTIFRRRIEKEQEFIGFAITRGIGRIPHVPDELAEDVGGFRFALDDLVHLQCDDNGLQGRKLRMGLDARGNNVSAQNGLGLLDDVIEIRGTGIGSALRPSGRVSGEEEKKKTGCSFPHLMGEYIAMFWQNASTLFCT
ncbi:MAG: hypothetical protein LAN84_07095 [Acidobacteriia bacterium]|nr:hypothetical protein [Terriglobia bacterium]